MLNTERNRKKEIKAARMRDKDKLLVNKKEIDLLVEVEVFAYFF